MSYDLELALDLADAADAIARRAWHVRGLGDFWGHMLVAEGAVDGAIDALGVSEWDLAPVQVIVEEAGGRFSDFSGVPRIDGRGAITSNGLLHEELLSSVARSS
jgi:histidinol-phosphatase